MLGCWQVSSPPMRPNWGHLIRPRPARKTALTEKSGSTTQVAGDVKRPCPWPGVLTSDPHVGKLTERRTTPIGPLMSSSTGASAVPMEAEVGAGHRAVGPPWSPRALGGGAGARVHRPGEGVAMSNE